MWSPLCFITAVQRLGKSFIAVRTPSLLMRLITRVTSLDTSSMLLKLSPRGGYFNFGNKSKSGGLMSGLYGGWESTCHPYFSKISDTAPETWGRALSCLTPVSFFFHFKAPFCRTGTSSLRYRTQCSLLKSGSQLLRKSEQLYHPTGHARAVCRTFEMAYVSHCWSKKYSRKIELICTC
jgi:hypothetical protein